MTAADWNDLYQERLAIMCESGTPEVVALARAQSDTINRFVHRPLVAS